MARRKRYRSYTHKQSKVRRANDRQASLSKSRSLTVKVKVYRVTTGFNAQACYNVDLKRVKQVRASNIYGRRCGETYSNSSLTHAVRDALRSLADKKR